MALNLKGLLSRKKKTAAADDRDEPFFTGATLGPGLGDDPDDDATSGGADGAPQRGFDSLLDDEAWGPDEDDGGDDDRPTRGGNRKRIALFAAIGLGAAAVAGGGAWWVMTSGLLHSADTGMETADASHAAGEGHGASQGEGAGYGSRVSLPMPPAPGLEGPGLRAGGVVVDPTAATDKSVARRPWLAEDATAEPAATAPHAAEPAATAPNAAAPVTPATGEAKPAAPGATTVPQAPAAAEPKAAAPAEPQTAAVTAAPAAPAAPAVEEVEKPDPRTADAPPPTFDALPAPAGKPEPLKAAPQSDLVRNTPAGPLPIAAPDGRKAWSAYARPFQAAPGTPRVAIVVADLGLLPAATEAAIAKLPPGVTLAFSPYGFDTAADMKRAREAGHEVMLSLPMEDRGFPAHDPGPLGLNTVLPINDNLIRLNMVMTKGVGYVGVLGRGGAAFTAKPDLMKPMLDTLARAGLLYLQPPAGVQLASYGQVPTPTAVVDMALDERPFRAAIDARLKALEALARERGSAVAVIDPTPLSFDAVTRWLADAQARGVALAPVSAVVRP